MGKIAIRNLACIDPNCGSSDARQLYEDGSSYCFSCTKYFEAVDENEFEKVQTKRKTPRLKVKDSITEIATFTIRGFKERKIEKKISEFFEVRVSYNEDGEIEKHYYPYYKDKELTGYHVRVTDPKDFYWVGEASGLFGINKFAGGGKRLIITEGELDAMAIAQAHLLKYGKIYPVISLSGAARSKDLLPYRDWVRSFAEVVIFHDNDEAGIKCMESLVKIVGPDKAKVVSHPPDCKDACDILKAQGSEKVLQVVWDSKAWVPTGIITKEELWEAIVERNNTPSLPYPDCLAGIQSKTKGIRTSQISLFISGTGSGKSTLLREILLHILQSTNDKIGVVSLEETPAETGVLLSSMAIRKNPAHTEVPEEELKKGFDAVFGDDRVVILDHTMISSIDQTIVDKLEYMALVGCKYLLVDHITILVSEGAEGLTGNEAIDKTMNDFLRLVKRHDVWLGLVSHLRKTTVGGKTFEEGRIPNIDDIRGSGSIKQISFDIIAFARNMIAQDEVERNTILMRVLKCRSTGLTGDVPGAIYDYPTGRLVREREIDEYISVGPKDGAVRVAQVP